MYFFPIAKNSKILLHAHFYITIPLDFPLKAIH